MKYKIIIIDDEQPARNIISDYLSSIKNVEIIAECSNGFEGLKAIEELKPDIVFLDIQMPKLTGFEMLELIENPPLVIFSTAYDHYAIKAFEVNAIDYLLKPFSKTRFDEALKKSIEKLQTEQHKNSVSSLLENRYTEESGPDRIVVKKNQQIIIIPIDEVMNIQAEDDYVMIHAERGKFLKNSTMNYYEKILDPRQFIRIHRSNIIHIKYIERIEKYDKETHIVHLKNGEKIKSSKSGSKILKNILQV